MSASPGRGSGGRALRRAFAPTFPAGELLLFIPRRWSPRDLVRRLRRAAARSARAADFVLVELLVGDWGRRWNSGGRAVRSYGGRPASPAPRSSRQGAKRLQFLAQFDMIVNFAIGRDEKTLVERRLRLGAKWRVHDPEAARAHRDIISDHNKRIDDVTSMQHAGDQTPHNCIGAIPIDGNRDPTHLAPRESSAQYALEYAGSAIVVIN